MRLFVAVDLGDAARAAIHAEQRHVASAIGRDARFLRFVRQEHLHLTLVFLGEVPPGRLPAIGESLLPGIDQAPFTIAFGGIRIFPLRGAPRVLWLDLARGGAETLALRASVADRLRAVGITGDDRPFTPHVSLARWRKVGPRRRPPMGPPGAALPSVRVESVTLLESRLSDTGPAYTALVRTALACR